MAQPLAYGARNFVVAGDFDTCLELARDASVKLGVYLLNSINPFRLEGQKTIVLELLQQFGWDPPDWIVVPAGNLGNTAAFGNALREARACGLISRVPRIAAVQAAGAAPFAMSFAEGFAHRYRVEAHTVATAISIGNPASYDRAVVAIRETNGVVTAVSDEDILEAKAVVDAFGVGCEARERRERGRRAAAHPGGRDRSGRTACRRADGTRAQRLGCDRPLSRGLRRSPLREPAARDCAHPVRNRAGARAAGLAPFSARGSAPSRAALPSRSP